MHLSARIKLASFALGLGLILTPAPQMVLADGYAPLNLPERGVGPSGVQGESTTSATPSPSPSATESADKDGDVLSTGTVQRVEDGQLVLEVDGEERKVALPEDVKVTRDGQEVQLNDIESGDLANFERNEDGDITEVRVASQQSMDFWRGFLPILLVVLVGFYLLSRRTKRSA